MNDEIKVFGNSGTHFFHSDELGDPLNYKARIAELEAALANRMTVPEVKALIVAEREACATIAESFNLLNINTPNQAIAAAIRARAA